MLTVSHLRKEFDSVVAVDDVSLAVKRGELFGLLGPNGAGKTTTIRTILNIIKPDRGEIRFDGQPFSPATWNIIGYLPEERGLYRKSRIDHTILYFASLKGVSPSEARPRMEQWLERFGLTDRSRDKVEELSKGNQQKVQIVASLIHNPQLLVLDEPFSGLDPVNQVLLKDILMEIRKQNVAIIFSTHQMEQVEKMCDNICLINKGAPVLNGPLREIKRQYGKNAVHLEFDGDATFLKNLPMVKRADIYENYAEVELADPNNAGELLKHFNGSLTLRKFEIVEPSLNSIFIDVVGLPLEEVEKHEEISAAAVSPKKAADPKLRRSLLSVALLAAVTLVLLIANVVAEDPQWLVTGILFVATGVSVFKYLKLKKSMTPKGEHEGVSG